MAGARRYRYRVEGFGTHVDFKVVEFLEEMANPFVCSYCGIVKLELSILSCFHVICNVCKDRFPRSVCRIDNKKIFVCKEAGSYDRQRWNKQVRCLYADHGCDKTPYLSDLSEHLHLRCNFHMTTCPQCEETIIFKNITNHHLECKGRDAGTVVLAAADARSLLEDFGNARSELQRALDSTTEDGGDKLKAAVASLSEQFARLQSQLAVPGANAVASGLSRPGK